MDILARKVYELPDYEGNPSNDVLLENLLERHCTCTEHCKHPNVQLGQRHVGNLLQIDNKTWEKRRNEILEEMWRDYPDMSPIDAMSSARNTYREDANTCFSRHGRPKEGCIDYKEDSKRISTPSKSQYLAHVAPIFLCDFCPIKSWVQGQAFHKKGLYK